MAKSAKEIFGTPGKPQRSRKPWFGGYPKKEGPRVLNIKSRACKKCGETTTSATRYFCAGCHFANWWGKWEAK